MKTNLPNPLIPQGTFPDSRGKSRFRIAALTIGAIHLFVLAPLLFQGCKRTTEPVIAEPTNPPSVYEPFVPTNPPALPPPPTTNPVNVVPPVVTEPPPTVAPPAATGTEHVVVKGDSFYTLGLKYKVSSKAIAEANPGVDSTRLRIGQKLNIPPPTATLTPLLPANGSATSNGGKTYSVKSGDTLMKIAKANGVSVKALRTANNLKTDRIIVGQKLKIPAKAAFSPEPIPGAPPPETPPGTLPPP